MQKKLFEVIPALFKGGLWGVIFLFLFSFSFAQEVTITQFPDSPREGEEVKLTLTSDKYNLNIANITWSIDGQVADSGVGRKTLVMNASTNGVAQVVIASIEQVGFDPSQAQRVVEANTNFILYEGADSYVPPFYKGRRLPAKEGTVRTAIFSFRDGDITGLNSGNDTYTWRVNGEDRKDLSGPNKIINNILTKVTDNLLTVRIVKEDPQQNKKITDMSIPMQKTEVVVYKTDEKKLLHQVLGDTETAKQIHLLVEPFFFSISSRSSNELSYIWKINDIETKISTPWSVVFSGKEKDSVKINLDLLNNQKITQDNSRGFTFRIQ